MKKYLEYIEINQKISERIAEDGADSIERAAALFSDALTENKKIFLFGTGHSHILAEELFYRAGGLVKIQPILEPSLMLHISASESTAAERAEGIAQRLFDDYKVGKNDVIVIISNSGKRSSY